MNNILIFSDLHINQSSLIECVQILEEIGMLSNKYNCDTIISLGDTFDNLKPNSSELDLLATFVRRLDKKIILLAADSHESTTQEKSILNHYGILSNNAEIVKRFIDNKHLYCGHFVIKESNKNYGAKLSKKDLKNYIYVFLGHQHSYEVIKPNICHLGSCRWVNFDEAKDKHKIVALITDYDTPTEQVHFLKLKSPIPMIQLELSKNKQNEGVSEDALNENNGSIGLKTGKNALNLAQCQAYLDKLSARTKVKVKINNFNSYRNFLPLVNKYCTKFEKFVYETDFEIISDNTSRSVKTETQTFQESFTNWLDQQEIDIKIKEILKEEIK